MSNIDGSNEESGILLLKGSIAHKERAEKELEKMRQLTSGMTNIDFVHWLMVHSKQHGKVAEAFVLEAIRFYSMAITSQPKPKSEIGAFFDPRMWHDIAEGMIEQIHAKYEKPPLKG